MTQNEKKLILDFINKQYVIAECTDNWLALMALSAVRGFITGLAGGGQDEDWHTQCTFSLLC